MSVSKEKERNVIQRNKERLEERLNTEGKNLYMTECKKG